MDRRLILKGFAGASGLHLLPSAWAQQAKPGRWSRYESANFHVFSAASESRSREEIVALERFHALLSRLNPRQKLSPMKLNVYIADEDRDFEATWPGVDDGIAGFYNSSIEQVRAVTSPRRSMERQSDMPRHIRAMDARAILFHEYAHHFVAANGRMTYPRWYNEGFAEFISTCDLTDKGINVGKFTANRAAWLASGDWLNIKKFLTGKDMTGRDDIAMFYAQAWLATHYLFMTNERAAGFDRYCLALQDGADPLDAFEPAFGISIDAFDKELKAYKRKSIQYMLIPEEKVDYADGIKVERLGVSADDLLMPVAYLRAVPPKKDAGDTVAKVRERAAKHPGDPFAMRALALADIWYGDLDEARKQLDALLAVEPKHAETLHLSGLCDLRAGYRANDEKLVVRARGAFANAHKLDGTRAVSLFRYVECDLFVEGKMNEHMTNVLAIAYGLAPQITVLALVTGQALIQLELWEKAIFVLQPLASSAHGGQTPERAKVYLEAARAKRQADFAFFGSAKNLEDDYE